MVAVVHQSCNLRGSLNYNEAKVKAGEAKCLEAGYYPMEASEMSFQQKLRRLELLTELNQRTKVNSVHISLNFHPVEKHSEALLREIGEVFLAKIGFAGQPYLLYQHFDAGHPHIHLLTTNIQADGRAINLHNIGRGRARKACVEMEKDYGLVVAGKHENNLSERFKPVNVQRALYGKMETKRAMNGIINVVTGSYNFTSLAQLNAILGLYNIMADAGSEDSRVRKHEGLVFRMLDPAGNKVGVPVKASDFYSKPTLRKLKHVFETNALSRDALKARLKTAVDLALLNDRLSLTELIAELKTKAIDVVIRRSSEGMIYGITYVDHHKRVVWNGSELGKTYSARAILERCSHTGAGEGKKQNGESQKNGIAATVIKTTAVGHSGESGRNSVAGFGGQGLAEILLTSESASASMDFELKRKKKKKKRLRLSSG